MAFLCHTLARVHNFLINWNFKSFEEERTSEFYAVSVDYDGYDTSGHLLCIKYGNGLDGTLGCILNKIFTHSNCTSIHNLVLF